MLYINKKGVLSSVRMFSIGFKKRLERHKHYSQLIEDIDLMMG